MIGRIAGHLLFPLMACGYMAYMVSEQLSGSYRASTVNYALLVGALIAGLSVLVVIQEIVAVRSERDAPAPAPEERAAHRQRVVRAVAVFLLACILVYALPHVGYVAGFLVFIYLALELLQVRSLALKIAVPILTVLVVHFLFVRFFELPLPAGLTRGLF